ncbi:ABC transporter ATP-binding protein [Methanosphaerula palustris]|uniref:ABC transporter related n=1 Tax=Methanosphaerula palustris (strain ATCC BAA-1556 / DSM 19958 / E1-9c) TaxID=521011 RepID=B8GDX1_METPE|nr:polysaccharide ABC transporter ATP-binding protein [Methanosphaerula palustris]ACL17472.1 ABC transporter related [Methanosphaerula palustris E1-9c]
MSDDVAIRVKNLGKRYKLGQQTGGYKTMGETITRLVKSPFRRFQHQDSKKIDGADAFWALKNISFEVKKGEVIGFIGRNGAGKSTLLKILSRITAPTEGTVEVHGRIGSLLEVGTGFHPELTGRENIFLSGSIMGMKKAEIDEKFDEIVEFSEIEKFLDTPVKRYSSGMYVRLAFAVAAHLDPEILIVDEVLAVGDMKFQKKCLGKMSDVAKGGRTVLFVSHNMGAMTTLCKTGFLLSNGSIIKEGEIKEVVAHYLDQMKDRTGQYIRDASEPIKKLAISRVTLQRDNEVVTRYYNKDVLNVTIDIIVKTVVFGAQLAVGLYTGSDDCIFSTTNQDWSEEKEILEPGIYRLICPIQLNTLRKGSYYITISSSVPAVEVLDTVEDQLLFEILDEPACLLQLGQGRSGMILPIIHWSIDKTA